MSGCMAFDCAQESLPGHHYCAGHVPPSVVIDHLRAQLAEGAGDVVRATRDVAIVRAELVTKERNELRARVAELEAERDVWADRATGRLDRIHLLEPVVNAAVAWAALRFAGIEHMAERQALGAAVDDYLAATPKEPR